MLGYAIVGTITEKDIPSEIKPGPERNFYQGMEFLPQRGLLGDSEVVLFLFLAR